MGLVLAKGINEIGAFGVDRVMGFGDLLDVLELFDVSCMDSK